MISTLNCTKPTTISQSQSLRYCYSSRILHTSDKDTASRLVRDPNKLEIYGVLLHQQTKGVSTYFTNHKTRNLAREVEDSNLLKDLFDSENTLAYSGFQDDDFIIVEKFNRQNSKINLASQNTYNEDHKNLHNAKNDKATFDELLKSRYQAYKKNFEAFTDDNDLNKTFQTNTMSQSTEKKHCSFVNHVQNTSHSQFYNHNNRANNDGKPQTYLQFTDRLTKTTENFFDFESKVKQQKDTASTYDSKNQTNVDNETIAKNAFLKKKALERAFTSKSFFPNHPNLNKIQF